MRVEVTPTEYKVAHLMYEHGWSNARIAQEMNISPGSVKCHTRHIYGKIGVDGDRALFVWMRTNELIPVTYKTTRKAETTKRIEAVVKRGETRVSAIASITGLCKDTVRKRLKQIQC